MMASLKSEFRKLLTVRSTYYITAFALLVTGVINFFVGRNSSMHLASDGLASIALNTVAVLGIAVSLVSILLVVHEYRHNTIGYSLTIANRRLKVMASKMVVVTAYAVVMAFLTVLVSILLARIGMAVKGVDLVSQDFDWYNIAWRTIIFMIGSAISGLVFGFLFRGVAAAVVLYFVVPTAVEPLLTGLLKFNPNYMPFLSQSQILINNAHMPGSDSFTPLASAGVFFGYVLVGLIVSVVLFLRRDAN